MKTRPNLTVPGRGTPWFANRVGDAAGDFALSPHAQVIRALALSFPTFQVPKREILLEFHRHTVASSGSRFRPYGMPKIKEALGELDERGFYAYRRVSWGRLPTGSTQKSMAYARLFTNEPGTARSLLDALTDDEIRDHDRATRAAYDRWKQDGIWPGYGTVISLEERRAAKAG